MRKFILAALGLGLLVARCAPLASPEQQADSADRMRACLHKAALSLDDGKSDATTIAYAATTKCGDVIEYALRVHADPNWSPVYYENYMEGGRKQALAVATEIVLQERRHT